MPDYHLRSVEKVLELPVAKEAIDAASSLREQALESPTYNKIENLLKGNVERIAPVKNAILSSAENNIPEEVKTRAVNLVSHLDTLVSGGIERVTTDVPVLAKPSSEIVLFAKKTCSALAKYMASFRVVRIALRLGDSTFCLMEIMAQTVGTPIAEPLGCIRRIIHSILDQHADSAEPGVQHPEPDDAKSSAETHEMVIATEPTPTVGEDVITEITEAEDAANTEASKSTNDLVKIKEDSAPEPEQVTDTIDEDFSDDFPEEVLRKTSSLAVKQIEPIQLRIYEKRMDGIVEEGDFNDIIPVIMEDGNDENTSTPTEDTAEDTITIADDSETALNMSGKDSFEEDLLAHLEFEEDLLAHLEDYFPVIAVGEEDFLTPLSLGDSVPVIPEESFIAPPAPFSASSPRRYPGYRHLYNSPPYQERYDMVGPIKNLVDDMIGMVPQLSSSGVTSRITFSEKPEDFALSDDSFDSSF